MSSRVAIRRRRHRQSATSVRIAVASATMKRPSGT